MTCMALGLTVWGTGDKDTTDIHTKKAGVRWTVYSDGNTPAPQKLLHTAEGGELANLGRGLCRRAVSGCSHPLQEEAVAHISTHIVNICTWTRGRPGQPHGS